ncbi:site-specific integrase [Ferrovum sp.]|uniref:tyrosine-type recombinase/integrase n=1 Tax=Ferrovum sp. TaxID=2609467 RepID=UPI0026160935|nr:site-specific integrase [Ferrovum sp.]
MPKIAKSLGPLEVSRLSKEGFYSVGGCRGLHLRITGGSKAWVLRITIGDRRRDIGLGPYPETGLADARRKAQELRDKVAVGVDPVAERKASQSALKASQARQVTFKQVAGQYLEAKASEKTARHTQVWRSSFEMYVYPVIGDVLVQDVDLPQVVKVLEPIWNTLNDTATKLRGRVEAVLSMATVRGYRTGPNPADWKGNLDQCLPMPSKVAKVTKQPALPFRQIHDFLTDLHEIEGMGALALEFAILCASRSGEVRGAKWSEIDFQTATWTIPAERMKAKREHRVPLSDAVIKLLENLPKDNPLMFPALRGGMLSDMTISAVCRRINERREREKLAPWTDEKSGLWIVPHGFRSTFRDWCSEQTAYPREVAEMALAHTIGNQVEASYRRGDLFEKRRHLMLAWAEYCQSPAPAGHVIQIRKEK